MSGYKIESAELQEVLENVPQGADLTVEDWAAGANRYGVSVQEGISSTLCGQYAADLILDEELLMDTQ